MKIKMAALSVMLLASVSTVAPAQDRQRGGGDRGDRGARSESRSEPRGERGPRSTVPAARSAPVAREAQAPREAPAAPQASGERQPGVRQGGRAGNDRYRGVRPPGAQTPGARPSGDRGSRGEARDGQRFNNGQAARDGQPGRGGRPEGWRGDDRRDGDRGGGRRDDDRRWDGRNDNRRDGDRRWNGGGPRPDHPRWERRRYPNIYQSQRRYRLGAYYPPSGFSLRMWSYGDYLPRAWYGESYRLMDWWSYDLPMPPPGYEWVRSGADALLIDTFNGQVVQVVRSVFW